MGLVAPQVGRMVEGVENLAMLPQLLHSRENWRPAVAAGNIVAAAVLAIATAAAATDVAAIVGVLTYEDDGIYTGNGVSAPNDISVHYHPT